MPISKKNGIRIVVTLVILSVVFGLWLMKNRREEMPGPETVAASDAGPAIGPAPSQPTTEREPEPPVRKEAAVPAEFALQVTEPLDLDRLKSHRLPILLDFGADSCIPCKEMAPILEKLNRTLQGKAIIRFVDVWKNPEFAEGFPLRLIPTQVLIDRDGNPYVPSDEIGVDLLLYADKETEEHLFTTHEGGLTEEMILQILGEMGVEHD